MARVALTIFTSAFLLFQVQPLIARYILPWFGGGPAIWTTCMLFFQVVLLAGYGYVHTVPVTGGTPTRLTPDHEAYEILPNWSPDGAQVLFQAQEFTGNAVFKVMVMDADGSSRRTIAQDSEYNSFAARWSPDGRTIVFLRTPIVSAIVRVDVAGILAAASND